MQRFVVMALALAIHARGSCRSEATKPGAAASSVASAAPAAPAATQTTWIVSPSLPSGPARRAPFEVVNLFDLGRHGVSRFAYSRSTEQLFVSFDHKPSGEWQEGGNSLEQWSVPEAARVHSYPVEKGWMVDDLYPSPDGRYLIVGLYHSERGSSERWEKYTLVDAVKHEVVAADLEPHDVRSVQVDFGVSGKRVRITGSSGGDPPRSFVYDTEGRPATADPSEFPERPRRRSTSRERPFSPQEAPGKVWVIESFKGTTDVAGLYYTDAVGNDHMVTRNHWHENYDLTRDGQYVVSTTWDGEVVVFSTAEKQIVSRKKIAGQYGHLAYDEKNDRFLLGDVTHDGTTHLRALVRVRGR
jgi:hypothetical protein